MAWWPFGRKSPALLDAPAPIETPPVPTAETVVVAQAAVAAAAAVVAPVALIPAGVYWCSQFPGSNRLEDLAEPFRTSAQRFVAHLLSLGCRVEITATLRPEQRAFLMLGAWRLVKERARFEEIEVRPDIPIRWTLSGALDMYNEYGLVHRPALDSLHIRGQALDMKVLDWFEPDEALYALAAEFGVHHLAGDPVHYSATGH